MKRYRVNRLKLGKLKAWLDEQGDETSRLWCPRQFSAGRHGTGLLTVPQKKDLLRHVISMAASNKALWPQEVKQAMFKMCLINKGVLALDQADHQELPWSQYEQYLPSLEHIYRNWRDWVKTEYPDKVSLTNSKTYYKSAEEAASITPHTINLHFDKLEELLLETKLMDSQTRCLTEDAGRCIWTVD